MNILIITSDVGKTAPGIVFERLIMGLSNHHNLTLISANNNSTLNLNKVSSSHTIKNIKGSNFLNKPLISFFGVNLFDIFWTRKASTMLQNFCNNHFDLVFCFISNHKFAPLIAGSRISRILNCKLAVYLVDAIPALGWPERKCYYAKVDKLMNKYLKEVDAIYSSNVEMLKYQISTFNPKKNVISDVIYNPHFDDFKEFPNESENINYFVYTGKIYGLRNPKYILEGFEKLLVKYRNSKLIFVEANIPHEILSKLKKDTIKNIEFFPFTSNLEYFYSKATALIDIDAEFDDDVFMSSKITNYININRIIISESSQNSPSKKLFKNIDSIFQCLHDSDQIFEAMVKAIQLKSVICFNDRKEILSLFNLNNVIERLDKTFLELNINEVQ